MSRIFIAALVTLTFWSCSRDNSVLGPSLQDIYGDFTMLQQFESSRTRVDFKNGQVVQFTARFSKTVDWEIHVVGKRSGATKILAGKSKTVDVTNGEWNGTTTNLPMFKEEDCMAILSVPDELFFDTIPSITVDSIRTIEGFMVADFEEGINPGWTVFAQSGANMSFGIVNGDSAAEKDNFWDMGGEVTFDFLIGLIDFPGSAYGNTYFPLSSVPNDVYFNVFLGKPGTITNEIILFQFREDDNEDGVFQEASEDMYSLELRGIDADWSTISQRYSELVTLVNGQPANPAGNGIQRGTKAQKEHSIDLGVKF